MSPVTDGQRRVVLAAVSRLLSYPDEDLVASVPVLADALVLAPRGAREPLSRFVDHVRATPLLDLQRDYVSTFDLKRRCCLYLTYYLNGDTRRRGMALWRFAETYRRTGLHLETGELPDFLPVVLEYAVSGDETTGLGLLLEHREGLEVLRQALTSLHSPYADVVGALVEVLPALSEEELAAALRLAAEGPPAELVGLQGLEPFGSDLKAGARA
jgi:nitrate reductase delta subunit